MSALPSEQGSDEKKSESSDTESSAAVVETTECPNCGRTFVGDYCPECGQEAEPTTSLGDVFGGLLRELVDLERGFWATFVGLSLRPGTTLIDYLEGARRTLVTPGRYLAGTLVVAFGTHRLLLLLGGDSISTRQPPSEWNWEWSERGIGGAHAVVQYWLQEASGGRLIAIYLAITLALGIILWRLFRDGIDQVGEAYALSCFLIGHLALLNAGISLVSDLLLHDFVWSLLSPVGSSPSPGLALSPEIPKGAFYHGASAIYLGASLYLSFGQKWQSYLVGLMTWGWSILEATLILWIVTHGSGLLLVYLSPDVYGPLQVSEIHVLPAHSDFVPIAVIIFLHSAVEIKNSFY